MGEITLRNDFDVRLYETAGSDRLVCQAARVSTQGSDAEETEVSAGLINFLMKNRHGSPFEHGMMTFHITAPIFVWREFMRHRIGVSYNEQSGRYMELEPVFYVPPLSRPLIQVGKAGAYSFEEGTDVHHLIVREACHDAYWDAWRNYQMMLQEGVAKEVARIVLPVATYSSAYVTMNPRSLMHFLSLRTKSEDSMFPSYPQWEISEVARLMEEEFAWRYPLTYQAFVDNGRVCP